MLELTRVYRTTHRILDFLSLAMARCQKGHSYHHVNMSLEQATPCHKLLGEEVECVLLPQCACTTSCTGYCHDPVQHLLNDHWTVILHLLNRLRSQVVEARHITIMLDTNDTAECQAWLEHERKMRALPELTR